ncbi:MAG: dihydroorotate dehydrogenase [Candidatus Thorarchaeota archaeon]
MKIEGYWLASGILGVTASVLKRVSKAGADAIVTKSIGLEPREGNPGPILTTSHGGLINAVGLTNPGIDAFGDEMRILRNEKMQIVLSIFGSSVKEIAQVAEKGYGFGPDAIELNLSCPHAEIAQIAHDPNLTAKYVRAVKEVVDCQVFAKLTPNASDYVSVAKAAENGGADAVVAINTVRAMKIDIQQQRPVLGNRVGGLSGPPIFPIAVRCVYDLYHAVDIPVIGVGGVTSWEDAIEMHLAGASAIQIGTALLEGLDVFSRIKRGVQGYLRERGHSHVADIIGLAGRR